MAEISFVSLSILNVGTGAFTPELFLEAFEPEFPEPECINLPEN